MAAISNNYYNFSSSLFGTSSNGAGSSGSILGDYTSIRNGSYKKLLSAYYKKQSGGATTGSSGMNSAIATAENKQLAVAKSEADYLKEATAKLTATGTDSLFEKVAKKVTDEKTGVTSETMEYDMDKIASSVKDFATAYNSMLDAAAKTDNTQVLRKTALMVSGTKANKTLLKKVGMTIGSDNKLTVDETKLKAADMNDLKALFHDSVSYADRINQKAESISDTATNALYASRLYGVNGKYSTSNLAGSLFNMSL